MTEFLTTLEQASALQWALVGALVLIVWFLPALLALVFNRRQWKLIAVACVPAGFSLVAWSAVLVWSVTGNAVAKRLPKGVRTQA